MAVYTHKESVLCYSVGHAPACPNECHHAIGQIDSGDGEYIVHSTV